MSSNEFILEINKILKFYSNKFENLLNKKDREGLLSLCESINYEIKEKINA